MGADLSASVAGSRRTRIRHADVEDAGAGEAALGAGTAVWLAAIPTAVVTIAAIVVLGPPLGELLFPAAGARYWENAASFAVPEPTEQARFLIALTAPLLLAALTVRLARRAALDPPRAAALARGAELVALLAVAACVVAQRQQAPQNYTGELKPVVYFTLPSLVVAAVVAAGIAGAIRSTAVRRRAQRWLAESRARRVGALLVALAAIAVTLLPAINTDQSIERAYEAVWFHLQFTYDETMAVVDGRSPLGDFAGQYASLWPYVLAAAIAPLGSGLAAFTGALAALTAVTLLALYDILRRLAHSSIAALVLFLPLLATCGFRLHGPAANRFSLINYSGVMPLRYAGPFLLAWLLVRHLDGARPRRTWPLFLAAGLVVLNNSDFGLPALGATALALVWARGWSGAGGLRRELLEAAAGLAAAFALVTALLLARTGALPDLSLLFRYARVFALDGFSMLPIKPLFGLWIAIFLTHVGAVGAATVRALRGERDALTGMLAWSGLFGLGAGSYYVGHSLSELLIYTFPCWALSIVLLTLLTVRTLARTPRWPRPAVWACLVGFGLLVCSLAQTPAPWRELQRIASHGSPLFAQPQGEWFVGRHTSPGESVLIVAQLGHRIAVNQGLDDVEPYTGPQSIFTVEQLEDSVAALRAAGGRKLFVQLGRAYGDYAPALQGSFELRDEAEGIELWVAR